MANSPELVKTVVIRANPEVVFAFFTDPAKMLEWIGTEVELDPRPGGVFRVVPNRSDVVRGEYLEVAPPWKIVFTWGFEGASQALQPGASVVEITLRPVEQGTEVRLVHRALPDGIREAHAGGWSHYLARIAVVAEGGDAGPDPLADPRIRHGAANRPGTSVQGGT
jgi:uncharacterized protein YndB with AHSA1/START domain